MTTPLSGIPIPTNTAASADIIAIVGNLARYIDSRITPRFANVGVRNTAYDAWVAAGNTMTDGLTCTVAGVENVYRGGVWRGTGYTPLLVGTAVGPWTTPVADNDPRTVRTLNVPDYGFPYRLRTYGGTEVTTVSCRADSVMDVGGTRWDFLPGNTPYPNGADTTPVFTYHKHADISPVFSGAKVLNLIVYRATGAGSWTSTGLNAYLSAEVVPA